MISRDAGHLFKKRDCRAKSGTVGRSGVSTESYSTARHFLFSPEEIFLAIDFVALREALVVEVRLTVGTLETLRVPAPLQDLQYEPVQDGLVAARTLGDGRCGRGRRIVFI